MKTLKRFFTLFIFVMASLLLISCTKEEVFILNGSEKKIENPENANLELVTNTDYVIKIENAKYKDPVFSDVSLELNCTFDNKNKLFLLSPTKDGTYNLTINTKLNTYNLSITVIKSDLNEELLRIHNLENEILTLSSLIDELNMPVNKKAENLFSKNKTIKSFLGDDFKLSLFEDINLAFIFINPETSPFIQSPPFDPENNPVHKVMQELSRSLLEAWSLVYDNFLYFIKETKVNGLLSIDEVLEENFYQKYFTNLLILREEISNISYKFNKYKELIKSFKSNQEYLNYYNANKEEIDSLRTFFEIDVKNIIKEKMSTYVIPTNTEVENHKRILKNHLEINYVFNSIQSDKDLPDPKNPGTNRKLTFPEISIDVKQAIPKKLMEFLKGFFKLVNLAFNNRSCYTEIPGMFDLGDIHAQIFKHEPKGAEETDEAFIARANMHAQQFMLSMQEQFGKINQYEDFIPLMFMMFLQEIGEVSERVEFEGDFKYIFIQSYENQIEYLKYLKETYQ